MCKLEKHMRVQTKFKKKLPNNITILRHKNTNQLGNKFLTYDNCI